MNLPEINVPKDVVEAILSGLTEGEKKVVTTAAKAQSLTTIVQSMALRLGGPEIAAVLYQLTEDLCMQAVLFEAGNAGVTTEESFCALMDRAEKFTMSAAAVAKEAQDAA